MGQNVVQIQLINSEYIVYVNGDAAFNSATAAKALAYANTQSGLSYTSIDEYLDTTSAGVNDTQKEIYDLKAEDSLAAEYIALITQAAGAAPTVQVIKNELSAAIVWARSAQGIYTGTLVGAFTANKTAVLIAPTLDTFAAGVRTSADVVTITTDDIAGAAQDSLLTATYIQIIVGA